MIVVLLALLVPLLYLCPPCVTLITIVASYLVTLFLVSLQFYLDMKPEVFAWKIFILPLPNQKAGDTAYCFFNQLLIEVPSADPEAFLVY